MTKHEFIFSDQHRHRIVRHVTFWILWFLAYNLLFHIPTHVFKGFGYWGPDSLNQLHNLGIVSYFLKMLLVNSLLAVIAPQIAFTYALLYWLLPNYFYKKGNAFATAGVLVAVLAIYVIACIPFKMIVPFYNYLVGQISFIRSPRLSSAIPIVLRDQLTSLPIVAGLALMIKMIKRWWLKQKETEQLAREKIKAELQLLKAQIHPHFLFNTLNNIYFFTLSGSPKAPEMIKKLSDMLHYILNECNQPMVPIEKEIRMIQDYMALEKIRYGEQMNMSIELPTDSLSSSERAGMGQIAPLLLIPFVENTFKHGTSKMLTQPYVKLRISIENHTLHFFLMNSRPQSSEAVSTKGNIGLKNVRKRLELLYPAAH